jgi:hypothetical protein
MVKLVIPQNFENFFLNFGGAALVEGILLTPTVVAESADCCKSQRSYAHLRETHPRPFGFHQPNAHNAQPLKLRLDYNNTTWGNKLYIRTPRSILYSLRSSGDFLSTLKKCQFFGVLTG